MIRRREVFWTLERERDDRSVRLPIATYARYVEAYADATLLDGEGWHHVLHRHSA